MRHTATSRRKALEKELALAAKQEARMASAAQKQSPPRWKEELESKLPPKVRTGLESAFCKGFSLIFQQGKGIIEKGFDPEERRADHAIRDFAVQRKGGCRELRQLRRDAQRSDLWNLTVTTVEGIGLGALGIGMPDIVLFLGNLLKGIYETALGYGFEYDTRREQMLILKMMAAALTTGPEWEAAHREVDQLLVSPDWYPTEEAFQQQLHKTASVFAMDMLLLKFLQGLPIVGILGGASNPVYFHRVMKYVRIQYRKRYLRKQMAQQEESPWN